MIVRLSIYPIGQDTTELSEFVLVDREKNHSHCTIQYPILEYLDLGF